MGQQRKVRQSQTIVPFGVGAIFDFRGESFVACDITQWGKRGERLQSDRLQRRLRVKGFRTAPPVESGPWAPSSRGVPYHRFPAWLFCPSCRGMTRWAPKMEQGNDVPRCVCKRRAQLVPMRFVQVCRAGHLDDVDWRYYAHFGAKSPDQRQCRERRLEFLTRPGMGSGLAALLVRCRACKSQRSLSGISSPGRLGQMGVRCPGRQPWQNPDNAEECPETPQVVQRGASNVYFARIVSAIEIPASEGPFHNDDKTASVLEDLWFQALLTADESAPVFTHAIEQVMAVHDVSREFVLQLLASETEETLDGPALTDADLVSGEWDAFVGPPVLAHGRRQMPFVTRHVTLLEDTTAASEGLRLLDDRVDKVVLADRLREVRALEGFHRYEPDGTMVKADVGRNAGWLPAIEVHGEGVFVSFSEERLAVWENQPEVRHRAELLDARLSETFLETRLRPAVGGRVTARYVMLHTLAHLLIRQLSFESGYSAASLRERVYARMPEAGVVTQGQAGVLVYTAAGDAEGTLGGLVRQGEPPRLALTFMNLLEAAAWCSSDPLCAEHQGQGFASLNLAACHACTLVAETSCECGNALLDRALLVGSPDVPGFLQPVIEAAMIESAAGVG
jgi:hypothetical protein